MLFSQLKRKVLKSIRGIAATDNIFPDEAYSDEENFDDETHDAIYFSLIFDLLDKNEERYENQAKILLEKKFFEISLNGVDIVYKLTAKGCRYFTSENTRGISVSSWTLMGWRKTSKRRALPFFFAKSEAGVLID